MTSYRDKVLLAAATTLGLAGTVHAVGIYGTAMFGKNFQQVDSEPYGNSIAAEPDFPGQI